MSIEEITSLGVNIHPQVCEKIRACDTHFIERFGENNGGEKACAKLLSMGHELKPDDMLDICRKYCQRWTYPF